MLKSLNDEVVPFAGIDRVVLTSTADLNQALDALGEFRTLSDRAFRNLDAGRFRAPYGRVRWLVNSATETKISIQYLPRFRRMAPIRVELARNDVPGMKRRELQAILGAFVPFRLLIVELRLDFPWKNCERQIHTGPR